MSPGTISNIGGCTSADDTVWIQHLISSVLEWLSLKYLLTQMLVDLQLVGVGVGQCRSCTQLDCTGCTQTHTHTHSHHICITFTWGTNLCYCYSPLNPNSLNFQHVQQLLQLTEIYGLSKGSLCCLLMFQ